MSRADKRARRQAEHALWLVAHGYRCPGCGTPLDDDGLVDDADPREPRSCADCCGKQYSDDGYLPRLLDQHPELWDHPAHARLT